MIARTSSPSSSIFVRSFVIHVSYTLGAPQPARARDGAPGQITDDTALRHYLCLAIVAAGGRITPDDYANVWLEQLNPDRLYVSEQLVWHKLKLGMSPWDTGRGAFAADAAIMSIAPVGIINAGDPVQAYQDGVLIASIHQDGLERNAAAAVAAGVAAVLLPDATPEGVVAAMTDHSSFQVRRLVTMAADLARRSTSIDEFVQRFYATMLDHSFPSHVGKTWDPQRSVAATSREVLPAVVGLFLLCDGDADRAIVEGASIGRDADTIASVLGCLVGALRGAHAIRADWIADSEEANSSFFMEVHNDPQAGFHAMAQRMMGALAAQHDRTRQRVAALDAILPSQPRT